MTDCLYIAWNYLRYHRLKTLILVAAITLIVFLPAGVDALVDESAMRLRHRADSTPLLIGARGSETDLVLNALYFDSAPPVATTMAAVERVRASKFASAIPLHVGFRAQHRPIVGTTLEYFEFRELRVGDGRLFAMLGECVIGHDVAAGLGLGPGSALLSSPENVFDLAGVYPLKMRVVGVLAPSDSPDDAAVFVDVKTAWVIAGLGHGHQDLKKEELIPTGGKEQTANASVLTYTEITAENLSTFHFHGDPATFPVTAVIAVPRDQKSKTLLMGRYQKAGEETQIVQPIVVMDSLLATILRVRAFVIAGALLLGSAASLLVVLVFMLSLRLRRHEMTTMMKIGASRLRIATIVGCEIGLVVGVSCALAAGLTLVTRRFGEEMIRWFLL